MKKLTSIEQFERRFGAVMAWLILGILVLVSILHYGFRRNRSPRLQILDEPTDLSVLPEKLVVLDIETTGLDPTENEIIEIGAIKFDRDLKSYLTFQSLIKPKHSISDHIASLTGISNQMLESDGAELKSKLIEFIAFIGDAELVAYNVSFDISFLQNAAKRNNLEIKNRFSCALKAAQRAWPDLPKHKLTHLARISGRSTEGHHRALKDAEFTFKVYAAALSSV